MTAISLLGIALLVFLHELGHFGVALAVGIKPRSFYVGFPFPPLVKTTRNGIEYGIGSIPLGGLVRIPGMHRPAPGDADLAFGPAQREAPQLAPLVATLKLRLDAGDPAAARPALAKLRDEVERTELSRVAAKAANRGLRDVDEGTGADAYWRQPTWKRIAVILAGPGMNILIAVALFTAVFMIPTHAYRLGFSLKTHGDAATAVVDSIVAGKPAERMGLRPGDRVVAVGGKPVLAKHIPNAIQATHGAPVTVTVVRGGTTRVLGPARPVQIEAESFPTALGDSLAVSGEIVKGYAGFFAHLPARHKEIHTSVGIVRESNRAVREGTAAYLGVLGFISFSLAILNLLPLLPLDGGHILFSVIEGIRGRAVRREIYERVSAIGIAAFLLLVIVGLNNDFGGGG